MWRSLAHVSVKPFEDFPDYEDGSLDAGLWALRAVALPHSEFTLEEIAEVCGVSIEWIRKLEERALSRARLKLSQKRLTRGGSELDLLRSEIGLENAAIDRRN